MNPTSAPSRPHPPARSAPPTRLGIAPSERTASFLTTCLVIAERNLRKFLRTPQLVIVSTIQAALFLLIFRYVFGGAIDSGEVPYVDFLVPGYVVGSVLFAGAGAAVGVAEEVEQGFSDRLKSLPVSRISLLAGRSLADTVVLTWVLTVATSIALLVGFRARGGLLIGSAAFGLCVIYGFTFAWLFIGIGLLARNAQGAAGIAMVIFPLTAVSSAYVPVDTMPGWIQPFAQNQPTSIMTNAVRSLVLPDPALAGLDQGAGHWVALSLLWCVVLIGVSVPLAIVRYRTT